MEYLDFELEIHPGSGREYPLAVVSSPGGEGSATMHFPFDELALESRLKDVQIALLRSGGQRRQILSTEEQSVQDFGRALFEALFVGEVRSLYEVSQVKASNQDKGLRVKLRIQPPELATLPWEFLYSSKEREYVCLSSNTPLVRYIELPRPPQPLTITPPLRILGMTASPRDLPGLDVVREKQRIERAIQGLQEQGAIELTWLEGQTADDLQRAIRVGQWHVFHFIGHGDFNVHIDEGLIALVDDEGNADFLRATDLGRLLADHHALRLVVLNSCEGAHGSSRDLFSSTAAILVGRGIPAVLAMQYEITDRAAITLARAFYTALADGMPVDVAVSEARKTMSRQGGVSVEWGTPVLYMRSPDGVLFEQEGELLKQSQGSLLERLGHHISKRLLLIGLVLLVVVAALVTGGALLLSQPKNVGPSDNTSFTIKTTVQIKDAVTGEQLDPLHETLIITGHPEGGSVCQSRDNGQPQPLPNKSGTGVFKCNGTYKGGKLSYIETASSIQFTISGGTTCQSNLSFVYERLDGTFSNQNTISGTFSSDAYSLSCSNGGSINANAQTGTWNGTLIQGGSTIILVRFNSFVVDQQPWWKRLFYT